MYSFWLDKCLLPYAPEELKIKINSANKTLNLINEGEINILKSPKLTDIDFECEIPNVQYPFAVYPDGFKPASYFLNYFEELKLSKKPFQFIVSRDRLDGGKLLSTDIRVSLEDYTITESAKNMGDFSVKIKLKQYREYSTKTVKIGSGNNGGTAHETKKRAPSSTQNVPISIGCEVIVNGRLHKDSYGSAPGKTLSNYRGKINYIHLQGSHPYHVTTPSGDWLGWVTKDSVKAVT